ncbi:MAG: DegV family EDD domain-containing protein [Lachnospiraceae bacterium]|nr:DegV family EDD domain-containing protein [Lachnospiraceae bacterium]
MKIRKFFNDVKTAIMDPGRDFSERLFISFSIISEIAVIIALIADIIVGESIGEIITLVLTIIAVPTVTFVCMYRNKLKFASIFLMSCTVFLVLPALFFFGGGVEGGGVLWFIFVFVFVGIVATGALRVFMLMMIFLIAAACFLIEYNFQELVAKHSRSDFFIDLFISLMLVGAVCYVMTWFLNRLFKDENERARKEAERAEELTRAQNRFFSSMSHEIRTPINSILGLNELILRDTDASDEIAKDAAGIQGSGKMLLALINDILDFSKMEAGSMDIVPVDYNVGDMMSEVVNMIWLRAEDKGLNFNVTIDPKVPSVLYGDEVRIKQVIINLLNNAVKYTKEGSVELHVESEEADDDTVLLSISVTDTGMGIRKEALPYLFDAFRRVDEEKNRHIEGTGLGLSIVKQIVELMDGTVNVNSIYGEGSTFTVTLKQGVSDHDEIGELNIHNQQTVRRSAYESSFRAPDAKVLIVDDNEMNLEVECRLLSGTEMTVDTAASGKAALELTVKNRYDVILMDHLMPEMDGIECLDRIRHQTGGLNRHSPVLVLTANAGSENREIYNRSGFDGYLVKPVSGETLEEALMRYISSDKMIVSSRMMSMRRDINASAGYTGKAPVVITSTSMCDLPDAVIKKLKLQIIPFLIRTEEGSFKDGVQMDADELVRYIRTGRDASSSPPDDAEYAEFFAKALRHAHHVIHISLTTSMSTDFSVASEAAKSFDNVTVINSECLSSAAGILVLIAHKLAQQNIPVPEIVAELEEVKHRLRCSFVIDTTEFMARRGLISSRVHNIAKALNLHPTIRFSDDRSGVGGLWFGNTKRAYRNYIRRAFPIDIIPDSDVAFITYADVPIETLEWIKDEISKVAYFEHLVFKQASAAISSNCGPGTFGILYFVKSNKSYNIGSYFADAAEHENDEEEEVYDLAKEESDEAGQAPEHTGTPEKEQKWYEKLNGIDADSAIINSGSEESFRTVLKIFHDSMPEKTAEINGFYSSKDWENYTIKIHALKSSARLIGANNLADRAQKLENAGKEGDSGYITLNHEDFMKDYEKIGNMLSGLFTDAKEEEAKKERPVADDFLMDSVYEGIREGAETMNCDAIEEILKELEDYEVPDSEKEKFKKLCDLSAAFDYDGIIALLEK